MCERPPRAASPRPCGDPRRETGWRSGRPGSPRPGPHPPSAQPGLDAAATRAERKRDAGRRWPATHARPGRRGPGHRAGCLRARRSDLSPRPPAGQRAVLLQGGDLGFQQLALEQHLAQLCLEALGLQRLAVGGPRDQAGLTGGDEGVLPSAQGRGCDAQCAREDLQVLPPQQAQDRIALALARHTPASTQTDSARSCCLRLHRHPPADHVRLKSVSANRGAQQGAKLVSLMDNIDTGTATGKMVVGVLAVLAEFERNLLMERCAAGVKIARQRNVRFGRPPKLTPSLIRQVMLAHDDASTTVPETCRVLGISKSSYYAALREGRRQALETAEAA